MPTPAHIKRFGQNAIQPHPLVTEYLNAAEITHDWTNLTGWTNSGVQVNSNRLYGISGANPSATGRAFAAGATTTVKVTAEIVEASTSPGMRFIGLNFGGTNNGVNASLPNFIGIGLGTASKVVGYFVGANFTGVTTGQTNITTGLTAGTYRATVVADETSISLVVQTPDGTQEWAATIPRSAAPNGGAITSIICWNGGTNGTSGSYIKAIGAKASLTPFRTKTNAAGTIEGNTDFVLHRYSGSDNWRIQLPAVMDGMKPVPTAVYFHQASTGTRNSPITESRWSALRQGLMTAGYSLLSADDGGDRWGNPTSVGNYSSLISWVQGKVYSQKVFPIGCSMGGLPMWNLISHKKAYPIGAAVGVCPVCDLIIMRSNPSFTSSIDSAWGSSNEATLIANSAGYDPMTSDPELFRRIPYLVNVGASDTIVPPADHADLFVPQIDPYAVSTQINVLGTGHLQVEQYDPAVIIPFLELHRG